MVTLRRLSTEETHEHVQWMDPSDPSGLTTGFYAPSLFPASAWILHGLYERDDMPNLTRAEAHANGWRDYDACPPAAPWRRLRWSELAQREGWSLAAVSGTYPDLTYTWQRDWSAPDVFPTHARPDIAGPTSSWPLSLSFGYEGALEEPQLSALVDILTRHTVHECEMLYSVVAFIDGEFILVGPLAELPAFVAESTNPYTPSNIWPEDRSWLVYTDCDLSATLVSGSAELIAAIVADPTLESIRVDDSPHSQRSVSV